MRTRTKTFTAAAAVLASAVTLTLAGTSVAGTATTAAQPRSINPNTRYVVAVSIDGLNPTAIRRLGQPGTPYLHYLMRNGAFTLNARTAWERTETLPNHAGMVTGRRVDARYGGHGVTFNKKTTRTIHRAAGHYTASVFDVVHDNGHYTALYTSKDKFNLFDRSYGSRHGAVDRVGRNNGRDKISSYRYRTNEDTLARMAAADIANGPKKFTFFHMADTDKTGHRYGYMTSRYLAAVKRVDRRLGRLVNAIRNSRTLKASTTLILTSDHGGRGKSHANANKAYNYTIPFIVWGPRTARGKDLYELNTDHYRRPGTSRPTWSGTQPIRNTTVANLALDFLGMRSVPGSISNDRQLLRATP